MQSGISVEPDIAFSLRCSLTDKSNSIAGVDTVRHFI